MRVFVIAPAVKAGSSILSWLLSQHSVFGGQPINERIELGAMLNVLDHIPAWRQNGWTDVGDEPMIASIRTFVDGVANPLACPNYGLKFTNFYSFRWLRHVFPNDQVIVIVRNVFDWYASIKLWNTARHDGWKPSVTDRHLLAAAQSLADLPEIKVVHLEDLITDVHGIMARVHEHLGLVHEPIDITGHSAVFSSYSSRPVPLLDGPGLAHDPMGRRVHLTAQEHDAVADLICRSNIAKVLYDPARRLR